MGLLISLDIDECLSNSGGCAEFCYNSMGSFYCQCSTGHELTDNKLDCQGKDVYIYHIGKIKDLQKIQ